VKRFLCQCAAIALRDLAVLRTYGKSAALGTLSGLLGLLSYYFIGHLVGPGAPALPGGAYFPFVCTGMMIQLIVVAALGALGSALAREANEGTLEPELTAGGNPLALIVGSAAAPALLASFQVLIYGIVGTLCFGLDLGSSRPGPAALAVTLTLIACTPVGLLGAAAWLLFRRPGIVTTAVLLGFGLLGGVYFPIALLPDLLAQIAEWVPLAAGLEALRAALLSGAGYRETLPALLRLVVVAGVTLPPSLLLLHISLRRAMARGTLALV
jgi:ABC-type polysaccharide/polyol phosphate export permease